MKVNKREAILLLVLLLLALGFAYFFFFMRKHGADLESLEQTKLQEEEVKKTLELKMISAVNLDKQILANKEKLEQLSQDKYSDLIQENQIILIKRLSRDTGLRITSMEFEERKTTFSELFDGLKTIKESQGYDVHDKLEETVPNVDESSLADESAEESAESAEGAENAEASGEGGEAPAEEQNPYAVAEGEEEPTLNTLVVNLQFAGTYAQVDAYLKNIKSYEKKIVVSSLNFLSEPGEAQSGEMQLIFFGINDLEGLIEKTEENYFADSYVRTEAGSAYLPYRGFVILSEAPSLLDTPSIGGGSEAPSVSFPMGGSVTVTPEKEKKVRLDSFEEYDVFFVGNGSDVYGRTRLSSLASDRLNSLRLTYDFFNPAVKNRANVVFDKNKKIIYETVASIDLDVYAAKSVGENKLGLTVMDSTGDEKDFYFEAPLKKDKWQSLSVPIGRELKYPIMLKGIFIEGDGIFQSVKGELHLDNLNYRAE